MPGPSPDPRPPSDRFGAVAGALRRRIRSLGASGLVSLVTFAAVIGVVTTLEAVHGRWPGKGLGRSYSFDAIRKGEMFRDVDSALERNAYVPELVRPWYTELMVAAFRETVPEVVLGEDGWLFLATTVHDYPRFTSERRYEDVFDGIRALVTWLEGRGTHVQMMLIPSKATVLPEKLPRRYRDRPAVYDEIIAGLRARGLDVVDLRDVRGDDGEPLFYKGDTHWRSSAAFAAATKVARRIEERFAGGAVPGEPVAARIRRDEPRQVIGDLERMLGLPESSVFRRRYRETRAAVTGIDAATGAKLGSSTPERVVHVGTSYSVGAFPLASQLAALLQRRVEDRAMPGRGPVFPLLEVVFAHLAGERELPELIVWELHERGLARGDVASIQDPLDNAIRAFEYLAGERRELPVRARQEVELDSTPVDGGAVRGVARSNDPRIVLELSEPVPGDGSHAVSFSVRTDPVTRARLWVDSGDGFVEGERTATFLPGRGMEYTCVLPIRSKGRRPVTALRIDPVTTNCTFTLGELSLWKRPAE